MTREDIMLKAYLAAPYVRKEQIREYAAELRAGNVVVTSTWLNEPHSPTTLTNELTPESNRQYAIQDVKDVYAANLLVFFTDPTGEIVRGGRHLEFGIALARRIPIFVVGKEMENIFHHMPGVLHFDSWEVVRDLLIAMNNVDSPQGR